MLSVLLVRPLRALFGCGVLKSIGDYSLSIYLSYWPILTAVSLLNKSGFITFNASDPFNLLLILAVSLLASVASFYCFERPIQAWIRKKSALARG